MNKTDEHHRIFSDLKLRLTLASKSYKFITLLPDLSNLKRLTATLTTITNAFQCLESALDRVSI